MPMPTDWDTKFHTVRSYSLMGYLYTAAQSPVLHIMYGVYPPSFTNLEPQNVGF